MTIDNLLIHGDVILRKFVLYIYILYTYRYIQITLQNQQKFSILELCLDYNDQIIQVTTTNKSTGHHH